MEQHFHMIGGEDKASFAKNSHFPRLILDKVKATLDECIGELVGDIENLHNGVKVGDLGCSSGPNVFFTAQNIIKSFNKHYEMTINTYEVLEEMATIHYFMNDLVSNDFNLVFKGLPEFYEKMAKENGKENGSCIIAVVPGTFYRKLFPNHSMHFLHSSYCLHWLSQAPKGLVTDAGVSMNKRNIHCARRSPPVVQKAYVNQFRHDLSIFLTARSRELVQKGQLLLTFMCENSEEHDDQNYLHIMASVLSDMVKEGYIEEEKLEHCNLPIHCASVDQIQKIIEEEGSFKILKFHSFKSPMGLGYEFSSDFRDNDDPVLGRARYVAAYLRAVFGPILAGHFGEAMMDDLFHRYRDKLVENGQSLYLNTVVISLKKEGNLEQKLY